MSYTRVFAEVNWKCINSELFGIIRIEADFIAT